MGDGEGATRGAPAGARAPLESAIADLWKGILGVEHAGPDDDFFALGGQSLAAVQMLGSLADALGVEVDFVAFFESPTVSGLADAVRAAGGVAPDSGSEPPGPPEPPTPPGPEALAGPATDAKPATATAPCTFAQERLWFIDQLAGGTAAYNEVLGQTLRGSVDPEALQRALTEVVARHAALRTSLTARDGAPAQVIAPTAELELQVADLRCAGDPAAAARELTGSLAAAPFDLSRAPMMRACLARVGEQEHVLLLVLHHAVCDGLSHVVLLRELGALYRDFAAGRLPSLPPAPVQYPDFARRQRERLQGSALQDALAPWRERLAGIPDTLDLPFDGPRPRIQTYRGATERVAIDAASANAIRALARGERATPFMAMLAVFDVLLHRYSGQETIMVGSAASGRDRRELDDVIGLFMNTIALRNDVSGDPSFRELLGRVRETVLDAAAHQDAPFQQIVAERVLEPDLSRHPIVQVFFAARPHAVLDLPGAVPYHADHGAARSDLTVWLEETEAGFELIWEHNLDLLHADTVARFIGHYQRLLRSALEDPDAPISALALLEAAERDRLLVQFNDTARPFPPVCVHELFAQRAQVAPDTVAVVCGSEQLTYRELDERANQLAHHLVGLGVGPDVLVGLCVERSLEMVVGLLGVAKAGGAHVPIDPEYPAERQEYMLEMSQAPVVLTQERLRDGVPAGGAQVVCLDRDWEAIAAHPVQAPAVTHDPEQLAYVIYTSGSTGQPKGVQIPHRALVNFLITMGETPGLTAEDVLVAVTTLSFDIAGLELYLPLVTGARLIIASAQTAGDPRALAVLLASSGATIMQATPTTWRMLLDSGWQGRAGMKALCGGEALPRALADRLIATGLELWNMYGPTEATIWSTCARLGEGDPLTIGRPIANTTLYILDAHNQPVPVGVAGELWIGGDGLARGYRGRPDLTAERFVPDPFLDGEHIYRTGDLARYRADGRVEFLGRIDHQVKVRGFRIELGEIETVLARHPGVADAVVIARGHDAEAELHAYLIAAGEPVSAYALREHVAGTLPPYMVPSTITTLEAFPLTPNGKVDRRALPEPVRERSGPIELVAPRTPVERELAEVWQRVLKIQRVGVHDNFFHLGGHSLLAAELVAQVAALHGVALPVRTLFEHPTLSAFAAALPDAAADAPAQVVPAAATARVHSSTHPLSFNQQQLLFFDALAAESVAYNSAFAFAVEGDLDRVRLQEALAWLTHRHEILRTVLEWDDTGARQRVMDEIVVSVPEIDCTAVTGEDELDRRLRDHARRPFDLARESPLRLAVFARGPRDHVVLVQTHHAAFDARAMDVLYDELAELYAALGEHRAPVLPALPRQYGDFARWQRDRFAGDRLEAKLDFWRRRLAGAPTSVALPTDHPRPAAQTFEGATFLRRLGPELSEGVRRRCQAENVTPYMLLLATFATLVYRRSGQADVLFGGPMANRDQPEFANLIGFFANTVVVRAQMQGNPTHAELVARIRDSVLDSLEHQDVPFGLVVGAVAPARDPSQNPLFQINFRVRVQPPAGLRLAGARTTQRELDIGLARFDLSLELHMLDDAIAAEWGYNSALFEPATIEALSASFERLLDEALAVPETPLLGFALDDDAAAPDLQALRAPAVGIRGFRRAAGH